MSKTSLTSINFFLTTFSKYLVNNIRKTFVSKLKSSSQIIPHKLKGTRFKNTKVFFITKTLAQTNIHKKTKPFIITKFHKLSLRFIIYRFINQVNQNILNHWHIWRNKVQILKHQLHVFQIMFSHLNKKYLYKQRVVNLNKCFYQWNINTCKLNLNESKLQYKKLVDDIQKEKEREANLKIQKEYFDIFKHKCEKLKIIKEFIHMKNEKKKKRIKGIIMKQISKYENILHKNFVYFYYRGVYRELVLMQTNTFNKINNNRDVIEIGSKDKKESSLLSLSQYNSLNNTISTTHNDINSNLHNNEEHNNKKKALELRKFLKKKMNDNKVILQKYFKRFHLNGIFVLMRTQTLSSNNELFHKNECKLEQYNKSNTLNSIQLNHNLLKGTIHRKITSIELKRYNTNIDEERHLESLENKFGNIVLNYFRKQNFVIKNKFTKWRLKSQYLRIQAIGIKPKFKKKKQKKRQINNINKNNDISEQNCKNSVTVK